jgi:GH35 family endo-1,4-beta-xylanase
MLAAWPLAAEESMEQLRKDTDAKIETLRRGRLIVLASPGAEVRIEQKRHGFEFGTALSNRFFNGSLDDKTRQRALEVIVENFNAAVPENAMKWGYVEPRRGQERWEVFDGMLKFCQDNDMFLRGHCIIWSVERFLPKWLVKLDDDELRQAVDDRIRGVLTRYKGKVAEYDLNNEMILWGFFKQRLGEGIRPHMFKYAHQIAPDTPMYVNDFRILRGGGLDAYVKQIRGLLDAGAPVGGIGIQGHPKNGIPSAEEIQTALDKLAKFDLPIKITEFAVGEDAGDDAADQLERLYRVAFAHPAVDGIYMWGFWAGAHWRPDAAPWRKDFSLTPAGETFRRLVYKQWWTDLTVKAGPDGRVEVPAFYGDYELKAGQTVKQVKLTPETQKAQVDLR